MIDPGVRAWPFVGRSAELVLGLEAIDERGGVVIFGASGVGKSRLARELIAARGDEDRWHRVTGSRGSDRVSFGAWSHLLPERWEAGWDDATAWRALADQLRDPHGAIHLLVDDIQWLDSDSASFVHHLVATEQADVVLAGRRDDRWPQRAFAHRPARRQRSNRGRLTVLLGAAGEPASLLIGRD